VPLPVVASRGKRGKEGSLCFRGARRRRPKESTERLTRTSWRGEGEKKGENTPSKQRVEEGGRKKKKNITLLGGRGGKGPLLEEQLSMGLGG